LTGPSESARPRSLVVATIAVALGVAVLVVLGTWQVQRLNWKNDLLAAFAQRLAAAPISLETAAEMHRSGDDISFLRVALDGRLDRSQEIHLYDIEEAVPGWRILSPMRLADSGAVLVDRGFVPDTMKDRASRAPGDRSLEPATGRVRLPEEPGWFTPQNDAAANAWYWPDLDAMAASLSDTQTADLLPFYVEVEATTAAGAETYPRPAPLDVSAIPNRHFSYALTWYGLAAALIAVYLVLLRGRRSA